MLRTVFLAHSAADREFALQLTDFLGFGCDVACYADDGLMRSGEDIVDKAEQGLAADVVVLLLSAASCPERWVRERWEPVLFEEPRRAGVEVVTVQLSDCAFPALLRRRNFIDGTADRIAAMRTLKRWLWQREREPGFAPSAVFSPDLHDLYADLADRPGMRETSGALASRFAREAGQDFEAVLWIPCHGRNLTRIAGELGAQLGLALKGVVEENCRKIRAVLFDRRCLLVLDAPPPEALDALVPAGRTSTLITSDPVETHDTPESPEYARSLIAAGRYAEAYELLYRLLDAEVSPEACARELTWICEEWGRLEEANSLRFLHGPEPSQQLLLF